MGQCRCQWPPEACSCDLSTTAGGLHSRRECCCPRTVDISLLPSQDEHCLTCTSYLHTDKNGRLLHDHSKRRHNCICSVNFRKSGSHRKNDGLNFCHENPPNLNNCPSHKTCYTAENLIKRHRFSHWSPTSHWLLLLFILLVSCSSSDAVGQVAVDSNLVETAPGGICTSKRVANSVVNFSVLRNCTIIDGNLLVLVIREKHPPNGLDIVFPELRVITGFFLYYRNNLELSIGEIFPNLAVVVGTHVVHNYAFVVDANINIQQLNLFNLVKVSSGGIRITRNPRLCFTNTILWDWIASGSEVRNVIKDNRKVEDCLAACSSYCNENCWSMQHCQLNKLCYKRDCAERYCTLRNATLPQEKSQCCHPSCIGGCTAPNDDTKCVHCKHVELQGRCVDRCPKRGENGATQDWYKKRGWRCVTEEQCLTAKANYDEDHQYYLLYKPENGDEYECVSRCPVNYKASDKRLCKKCQDHCEEVCEESFVLDNMENFRILREKRCTHVNGDLEIYLRKDIMKDKNSQDFLQQHLGHIVEIRGVLFIRNSPSIHSLAFFQNLRRIDGNFTQNAKVTALPTISKTNMRKQYAVQLVENNFLRELFTTDVQLGKNKSVLALYNRRLCPAKIEKMVTAGGLNYTAIVARGDISVSNNGDLAPCHKDKINLTVGRVSYKSVELHLAVPEWLLSPYGTDRRTFIALRAYYRTLTETEIEDMKEKINSTGWQAFVNNPEHMESFIQDDLPYEAWQEKEIWPGENSNHFQTKVSVEDLRPFSYYVLYARSHNLNANHLHSNYVLFKTTNGEPEKVSMLEVESKWNPDTEQAYFKVRWSPPKNLNGILSHYTVIVGNVDNNFDQLRNINYCTDANMPLARRKVREQPKVDPLAFSNTTTASCLRRCGCNGVNLAARLREQELNDQRKVDILFEDMLQDRVYQKSNRDDEEKTICLDIVLSGELNGNCSREIPRSKLIFNTSNAQFDINISKGNGSEDSYGLCTLMLSGSIQRNERHEIDILENITGVFEGKLAATFQGSAKLKNSACLNFFNIHLTGASYNAGSSSGSAINSLFTAKALRQKRPPIIEGTLAEYNFTAVSVTQEYNSDWIEFLTLNPPENISFKYFTDYAIYVRVNVLVSVNDSILRHAVPLGNETTSALAKLCIPANPYSDPMSVVTRTPRNETADIVELSSIKVEAVQNRSGAVLIEWLQPSKPNGVILKYRLQFGLKGKSRNEKCVPVPNIEGIRVRRDTNTTVLSTPQPPPRVRYVLDGLAAGNYSIKIGAYSLASSNNQPVYSKTFYFTVPNYGANNGMKLLYIVLIILAILVVIFICILFVIFYRLRRRKQGKPGYLNPNPGYGEWNAYEPDEWELDRDNIQLLGELGQGGFGMVYKGILKHYNEETNERRSFEVAVKTLRLEMQHNRNAFLMEASHMKQFQECNHVVKLLGIVSTENPVLVVMELMGQGDLKTWLRMRRQDEPDTSLPAPTAVVVLRMASEIADGMLYLSDKKFVHRDLAARNCMVDTVGTVKIGDFGLTRDIYDSDYYRRGDKGVLPVRWMAPESLKDGTFTTKSDVWSYGMVLWEMSTLAAQPYQGLSNEEVLKYVVHKRVISIPNNCPRKLADLMERCFQYRSAHRPAFTDILETLRPDAPPDFHETAYFYSVQRQELINRQAALKEESKGSSAKDQTGYPSVGMQDMKSVAEDFEEIPLQDMQKNCGGEGDAAVLANGYHNLGRSNMAAQPVSQPLRPRHLKHCHRAQSSASAAIVDDEPCECQPMTSVSGESNVTSDSANLNSNGSVHGNSNGTVHCDTMPV